MKTTLYLIRHGSSLRPKNPQGQDLIYGPSTSVDLDTASHEMFALAQKLSSVRFDEFITSPTRRAIQSTNLLFRNLPTLPERVHVSHGLRAVRCPSWIGKPVDGALGENGYFRSVDEKAGDETFEEYTKRVLGSLSEIVEENKSKTIGFMIHSEGIGLIMHKYTHPDDPTFRIEDAIPTGSAVKIEINHNLRPIEREARSRGIERI